VGKYKFIGFILTEAGNAMTTGDLMVTHDSWMVVEEWWDYPDGTTAPGKWIEVPTDVRYQIQKAAGVMNIIFEAPLDMRGAKWTTRPLYPEPPGEPQS
jgi:hypothetical protein